MDKSTIYSQMSSVRGSLSTVNQKLAKLRAAKASVSGVSTTLDYKVTSPGHLDGDRYDELEADEKDFVTNIKRDIYTKKQTVLSDLQVRISQEEARADSLYSSLRVLQNQLAYAED
ncbi:hypothetical protein ACEE16_10680 [Streptococcus suis]